MASAFVVDRQLGAVPVTQLLAVRTQLVTIGTIDRPVTTLVDRPVLAGGQALQPNVLCSAERSSALRYYLPLYQLAMDAQRQPAVELRYKAGAANEIGRLTLTLTWTPPQAAGVELRVIDHVASLALTYRVPVQGDGAALAVATGAREHTVPLQPLQQLGNQLARSTTVFTDKALFDSVYQAMGGQQRSATLDIQITARVGVRTWRQVI